MSRASQQGELTALRPHLLRAAQLWIEQPDDIEDLAQDVILRIWTELSRGERITDLPDFAFRTLREACRNAARPHFLPLTEEMLVTQPQAFAHLALTDVARAISRLPGAQARLIHLVAEGETSPAALARRLDLPPGTVMSRLARARAQLRRDLGLTTSTGVSGLI